MAQRWTMKTEAPPHRKAFSVSVLARREGRVLLIRHKRLDQWLPAGGEIEAGETPLEAAIRELREETGLTGTFPTQASSGLSGEPPGLIGYEEHEAGSKGTHLNFCFVVDAGPGDIRPNAEFSEWRWVAKPDEVECPPNVRQLIWRALRPATRGLAEVGRKWLAAFNRRDLDALLALYAEDAVHFSPKLLAQRPETKGCVTGKSALRQWWQDCFDRLPSLHYVERWVTADQDCVFVEYLRECYGQAPLDVAECFRCRAGLITESRVFHG
jgi:8-oxo-dGTP diphosphatase